MNEEEIKLNDKELHKAIDNLKGTQFLGAFGILDWIIKTRNNNLHQQKIINRLSRKIQKKNQLIRKLRKTPTLFGREVILVPDSKLKDIVVMSRDIKFTGVPNE